MRIGPLVYTVVGVAPPGFGGALARTAANRVHPDQQLRVPRKFHREGQTWWDTYNWTWSNTWHSASRASAWQRPTPTSPTPSVAVTKRNLRASQEGRAEFDRTSQTACDRRLDSVRARTEPVELRQGRDVDQRRGPDRAAHCVRERREPSACARPQPPPRNRRASRARREHEAADFAIAHREHFARRARRRGRPRVRADRRRSVLRAAFLPKAAPASVRELTRARVLFAAARRARGRCAHGACAGVPDAQRQPHVGSQSRRARRHAFTDRTLRIGLCSLQGALSVVLLVGAGLFVRSLHECEVVRMGYDIDPVLLVNLNMRGVAARQRRRKSCSASSSSRPRRRSRKLKTRPCKRACRSGAPGASRSSWLASTRCDKLGQFDLNGVSPGIFSTLGTRIIRGRGITAADVARRAARHGSERRTWRNVSGLRPMPSVNALG